MRCELPFPSDPVNEQRQYEDAPSRATATPAELALHGNFLSSLRSLQRDLVRSLHYLVAIHDHKVHRALGYASITDYTAAVAGFTENQTRTFLAIGRRLTEFMEIRRALAAGEIPWSKARVIVEKALPRDERHWIQAARRLSVQALRSAIERDTMAETVRPAHDANRAADPSSAGDRCPDPGTPASSMAIEPDMPGSPGPAPRADPVVTAEPRKVAPATDLCHVTYAFTAEEYSVWMSAHEAIRKRGRQESNTKLLLAALAALVANESPVNGPLVPRLTVHVHRCPDCEAATIENRRGSFVAGRALLASAECDAVIEEEGRRRRSVIPPRIRRAVLRRDGHRCQAAGCRNTSFLEIHHRIPISEGGQSVPGNLLTLCSHCHRELHRREEALRRVGRDPAI